MIYLQSISNEITQLFADQCWGKGEGDYCWVPKQEDGQMKCTTLVSRKYMKRHAAIRP